jgi:UDP-GlcNAc3NAcA epimerase
MLDATRFFGEQAVTHAPLATLTSHDPHSYYLATVHRAENTDEPARLAGIFAGLGQLEAPVLLPLHPRTHVRLDGITVPGNVVLMEPVSYLAMLTLVRHAQAVLTDSGGLQKEAFWLGVPCITLRDETEWVETLENGWNRLVGAGEEAIVGGVQQKPRGARQPLGEGPDGNSPSENIAHILKTSLSD